jgi:diguanylate cyclase (GGDEF)-like protein
MSDKSASLNPVRGWALWSVPRDGMRYLLIVDAIGLALAVFGMVTVPVTGGDWLAFGVLLACAAAHNELARGIERTRRQMENNAHVDLSSVWLFAGVLVLPMPLNVALIVLVYSHYWSRNPTIPHHRRIFGMAALVVSTQVTMGVLALIGGPGHLLAGAPMPLVVAVIVASLLIYTTVDVALIAGRVATYRTPGVTVRKVFGDPANHMLEISNLFYGAMVAFALSYSPALVVLSLPPVLVLHRSVLLKQVQEKARKDSKTGLFNSEGWHERASRERSRAARANEGFGLLMVDLDHFKKVNDTYGHVAGDAVLKAVADAISKEVRDYDSVGRFGGEEFVVLLPGMSEEDGVGVAERIRHAVTQLAVEAPVEGTTTIIRNLSASIGVSTFPAAGDDIEPLLLAADAALYQAKNGGRNQVVSSTALVKPVLAVAA